MLTEFEAADLYRCMDREIVAAEARIRMSGETPSEDECTRLAKVAAHKGYLLWCMKRDILRRKRSKADGRESLAGVVGEAPPRRTEGDSDPSGPSSLAEWREECNRHG